MLTRHAEHALSIISVGLDFDIKEPSSLLVLIGASAASPTLVVKMENCLFIYRYGTCVFHIYILLYLCVMQYFHIAYWFMQPLLLKRQD